MKSQMRTWLPCRQKGIALIAVLWIVAALTVIVMGAVHASRNEVRTVSAFKEMSVAGALTDAGIVLVARQLAASPARDGVLRSFEATLEGQLIHIEVIPLVGLVDLNGASEALLTDLISVAGGVERGQANVLAQRILDWRDLDDQPHSAGAEDAAYIAAGSPFRTRSGPFEVPEDLLQVLGVDFDLYVKLRRLVTVHLRGGGRISPAAAPLPVLQVLARGNEQFALDYASARDVRGLLADTTRFPADYITQTASSRFLLEASTRLFNGASVVIRKVVDVSSWQEGVPWTILWSERFVEPSAAG